MLDSVPVMLDVDLSVAVIDWFPLFRAYRENVHTLIAALECVVEGSTAAGVAAGQCHLPV